MGKANQLRKLPTLPRWHESARCTIGDYPPQAWNAAFDSRHPRRDRAVNIATSLALCADCPVVTLCAQQAVSEHGLDAVWAGVPVTGYRWLKSSWQAKALALIAEGMEPLAAIRHILSRRDAELLDRLEAVLASDDLRHPNGPLAALEAMGAIPAPKRPISGGGGDGR